MIVPSSSAITPAATSQGVRDAAAGAVPAGAAPAGALPAAGWPQRWQKRACGESGARQCAQARSAREAPQEAQKFQLAVAPQAAQVVVLEGAVMDSGPGTGRNVTVVAGCCQRFSGGGACGAVSSTSRTLATSAAGTKGLGRKGMPSSATPWATSALSA